MNDGMVVDDGVSRHSPELAGIERLDVHRLQTCQGNVPLLEVRRYGACDHIHVACIGGRLDATPGDLQPLSEIGGKQHIRPNIHILGFKFLSRGYQHVLSALLVSLHGQSRRQPLLYALARFVTIT